MPPRAALTLLQRCQFIGTSMGIVVQLVIGFLVRGNDFSSSLLFVGGMALLSIVSWTVIIGKIEQIR